MSNVISLNKSQGFTRMDNDLYEALIGADLSGRELRVALAIHRYTAGYNVTTARIPAVNIAKLSGIARENVSRIIGELIRQRVIYRDGGSKAPIGISPSSEWKIDAKNDDKKDKSKTTQSVISDTSLVLFPTHIKDSKDKLVPSVLVDAERQPAQSADQSQAKIERAKSSVPACPHQAIVDLFHKALPELPAVAILTETRKRTLQARWRESDVHRDLGFWAEYFMAVKASQFLTGKVPGRNGGKPFRATFDWLINSSNFVKVVEGNYNA
ncbi:MAG: phage replication protein [Pseudomonadaceae bacterium]|nr:phage replication protein [Pseudomonadaceae bacterium]